MNAVEAVLNNNLQHTKRAVSDNVYGWTRANDDFLRALYPSATNSSRSRQSVVKMLVPDLQGEIRRLKAVLPAGAWVADWDCGMPPQPRKLKNMWVEHVNAAREAENVFVAAQQQAAAVEEVEGVEGVEEGKG